MNLYNTVRIKSIGVVGTIVDISYRNGTENYIVESSTKGKMEGHDGGEWPLFDCKKEDLEIVNV